MSEEAKVTPKVTKPKMVIGSQHVVEKFAAQAVKKVEKTEAKAEAKVEKVQTKLSASVAAEMAAGRAALEKNVKK